MQYDPSLTSQENMTKLVNSGALYPFLPTDLSFGNPSTISAGGKNTQVVVSNTQLTGPQGTTTVSYNRSTLANVNPRLGTKIFIDNSLTTHLAVQQFICARLGLAFDQITFTNPTRVPVGGESKNYILNPIASSKLYLTGTLTLSVTNRSVLLGVAPTTLFGVPNQTVGGVDQFAGTNVGAANLQWARFADSELQNFCNMLNQTYALGSVIKPAYFTLGAPTLTTVSGSPTNGTGFWSIVDVTSVDDAFTTNFRTVWLRDDLRTRNFTGHSTLLGLAYGDKIQAVMRARNMPLAGIEFLPQDPANPDRLNYHVPDSSLLYYPSTSYFTISA